MIVDWIVSGLCIAGFVFIVGVIAYLDIKGEREAHEWWKYKQSHRHCKPCPYKKRSL